MTYSQMTGPFHRSQFPSQSRCTAFILSGMASATSKLFIPLALGCIVSVSVLVFWERSNHRLNLSNQLIAKSIETQAVASQLLSLVTDAETAQRGLVLTGRSQYLQPYMAAAPQIDPGLRRLKELTAEDPEQHGHVGQLTRLVGEKFAELEAALALYRKQGSQAAQELIKTEVGRHTMDEIRDEVAAIQEGERVRLIERSTRWNDDVASSRIGMTIITVLNLILVITIFFLARREIVQRERVRQTLEDQVRERTAELSELSSNLQNVREEERASLAHDIHDELGGILVAAKMDLSWVYRRLKEGDPVISQKLARAMESLDEGVDIKRRIIEDLRPTVLDSLGLAAAIDWYVEHTCQRGNLQCEVAVKPVDIQLPNATSIALFRIMQEALTNILRHANAKKAWITLEQAEDGLHFMIRDDGIGLPPGTEQKRLSHGILGMRQRVTSLGGQFRIGNESGTGATIRIFVPFSLTDAGRRSLAPTSHPG